MSGATHWRKFGARVLISAALVLIFSTLAVTAFVNQSKIENTHSYLLRTSKWVAAQIEFEMLRFVNELDRYRLGDPKISLKDVRLRYDILWSRFPVAMTGSESEPLRKMSGAVEIIGSTFEDVKSIAPLVDNLQRGDDENYRNIRSAITAHYDSVHDLVQRTFYEQNADVPAELARSGLLVRLSLLGMGVSFGVLVVFLLLEVRAGRRLTLSERNARVEAERANDAKSQFLANMSHELRTPLNAISGFSQLICLLEIDGKDARKCKEYGGLIERAARHLLRIIEEILDMVKLDVGRLTLDLQRFDLLSLIRETLTMLEGTASEKSLGFVFESERDALHIICDEQRVRQILMNLLSNAIKFTPHGGEHIKVVARMDSEGVRIDVIDCGQGIAEEDMGRVFEAFGQAERSGHKIRQGTGLGLTIARRFARLHGGDVHLKSELGKGTVASLLLPVGTVPSLSVS